MSDVVRTTPSELAAGRLIKAIMVGSKVGQGTWGAVNSFVSGQGWDRSTPEVGALVSKAAVDPLRADDLVADSSVASDFLALVRPRTLIDQTAVSARLSSMFRNSE